MSTLIQVLIAAVVLFLIFSFLLPMLTGIVHTVAVIVIVIATIIWLLRLAGIA